ncbi:MAG: DUF4178 domain-containing protein [Rubrivivax sp.]|nr:DUF4178 domain-containing protein [Rubrivivax sp.]
MATSPQRAYRAACPNCGAPVEFASAASASAVCSFCRSTLLRDGDALRRIGVSAELFDDHSPLQLGASGTRQGMGFTLVGRLQYGYEGGTWNEWHALFDNGRSAWLSEDNGAYVLAFDAPLPADVPPFDELRAGQRLVADRRGWNVASVVRTHLIAAEGELPAPPRLQGDFFVIDLRNAEGEVATIDASDPGKPGWSVGRSVALSELALQGLKDGAEKTLKARGIECPSCGSALEPKLSTTKSLSCGQCNSVVDISKGAGADLEHYAQNNSGPGGLTPQIPLGSEGKLGLDGPPVPWQVVGYMERCDNADGADDETTFWREYLLFHRMSGFAFLVDAEDGWSWVRPLTGAPKATGETALWKGKAYRRRYEYAAKVTWVQGEFYWRLQRDETARVADYEGTGSEAALRLSREQTGSEVTWSAGRTLAADAVAEAFAIPGQNRRAMQRDVSPLATGSSMGLAKGLVILFVVLIFIAMLAQCDGNDCDDTRMTFGEASAEYQQCLARRHSGSSGRSGGGSYGGWSSGGGGHK